MSAASPRNFDLAINLQQNVLGNLLGVLAVLHMPQRHLENPVAVAVRYLSNCLLVARLQTTDELPVVGPVHGSVSFTH